MIIASPLDLVSAILIFAAAIVPTYLSVKLHGVTKMLALALAIFAISHGVYHVVGTIGLESLADEVFEPISVVMLIAFGGTLLSVSSKFQETKS